MSDLETRDTLADRARQENFPVASFLLPRDERTKLLAVYAFARLTDDVGDEADGDRLRQLDAIERELDAAAAGTARHPVFTQLEPILPELDCGLAPFRDLIEANRVDQRVHAYATFDDLRAYCMLSAAPVGRIVLSIFSSTSPERVARSDEVCIGLQLVEHLQDVGEDAHRGRVYLPLEDLARAGSDPAELTAPAATAGLRRVIASHASYAAATFIRRSAHATRRARRPPSVARGRAWRPGTTGRARRRRRARSSPARHSTGTA